MTLWKNKAFTENELSHFGKAVVIIFLVVPVLVISIRNIFQGEVANPFAFTICLMGFFLFLVSKISLFRKGVAFSFGTRHLTENMNNCYRMGYWLMAIGLIVTFFE